MLASLRSHRWLLQWLGEYGGSLRVFSMRGLHQKGGWEGLPHRACMLINFLRLHDEMAEDTLL